MPEKAHKNLALFADKLLQRTVLGMMLTALMAALEALRFLLGAEFFDVIEYAGYGLKALIFLAIVPVLIDFIRLRPKWRALFKNDEGFVAEVFQKSAMYSFGATLIAIIMLDIVAQTAAMTCRRRFI
ncbi:MAG: hypothetical protein COB37_11995 [Kordiimonadales bacterium]|nr:MAG: hypothetical protein COB37_11995 [Kordiimonadales bacterium]